MDDIIYPGSRTETLGAVNQPLVPEEPERFFTLLKETIVLQSNGMGVALRESRYNISQLLEQQGFDYQLTVMFVDEYENQLFKQYYKKQEESKNG